MKVLFVCTGNICRSPTAHGILRKFAHDQGIQLDVDSAGILDYHEGENADSRSCQAALERGYDISDIISRPVTREDFFVYDWIFAMDEGHLKSLKELCPESLRLTKKIQLYLDFSAQFKSQSVPDPYYGGADGFSLVLDMLEDATIHFLENLKRTKDK